MATLTMQPIGPLLSTQEGPRQVNFLVHKNKMGKSRFRREKPAEGDGADLSDIDSGWVVLGKSDIVPADLAAQSLRSSPKTIPSWARWVIGGVLHTVVPFYERVRYVEDETARNVETAVEVVEHVAEVTEKLASNVADKLPEDGCLQKAVEKIEYIAEVVDEDAEKVEAIVEKIDKFSDKIDAEVEPVIKELEKEFKDPPSYDGVNAHI
ncbi:hypothetical protein E2562_009698 [Oryza meyeriana var. granulata]|uniref:Uncharacterized protein n=1 Tax=Oryza meyeriana var. granulata TaxID=110450 RepID=A0A6G1D1N7_9ORYZ|nr:hypothetical protein E2562_009698 [Oryza meyeriana var. granulata]